MSAVRIRLFGFFLAGKTSFAERETLFCHVAPVVLSDSVILANNKCATIPPESRSLYSDNRSWSDHHCGVQMWRDILRRWPFEDIEQRNNFRRISHWWTPLWNDDSITSRCNSGGCLCIKRICKWSDRQNEISFRRPSARQIIVPNQMMHTRVSSITRGTQFCLPQSQTREKSIDISNLILMR